MKVIIYLIILLMTSCSLNQRLEIKSLSNNAKDSEKIAKLNIFIFEIHDLLEKKKFREIAGKYTHDPLVYEASFQIEKSEKENILKEYFEFKQTSGEKNRIPDRMIAPNRINQLLDCKIYVYDNYAIMANKSKNTEIKLMYSEEFQRWKIAMLNTFPFHETLTPNQW